MSSNFVTSPPDFYGPWLKVERAEHHISDLETRFRNYVSSNVKRLRPERKHRTLKQGRPLKPKTFDEHIPTILGDAVHNLRAALDHAYHIAAEANSATWSDYRRFPFHGDRQSLIGSINGHKGKGITPSESVINVIVNEIQPYAGGKLNLKGLHDLDITDKHIVLIPTTSAMHIESLEFRDASGAKTGSGIFGITFKADQSKGAEFIDTGHYGAILNGNPQNVFDICFSQGQPFENQSIIATLKSLLNATSEAIRLIEAKT